MNKEEQFRQLLKSYGISKCGIYNGFNPYAADNAEGEVLVDVDNNELITNIYKMYTNDEDGTPDEGQLLIIQYDNYIALVSVSTDTSRLEVHLDAGDFEHHAEADFSIEDSERCINHAKAIMKEHG